MRFGKAVPSWSCSLLVCDSIDAVDVAAEHFLMCLVPKHNAPDQRTLPFHLDMDPFLLRGEPTWYHSFCEKNLCALFRGMVKGFVLDATIVLKSDLHDHICPGCNDENGDRWIMCGAAPCSQQLAVSVWRSNRAVAS